MFQNLFVKQSLLILRGWTHGQRQLFVLQKTGCHSGSPQLKKINHFKRKHSRLMAKYG